MAKAQTPLRALIVEDSEDDANLQLRELRSRGYDVTHRRVDTRGALQQALAAQRWDIVLSDYSLPGFTGLDALRILNKAGLDIPFILVSGAVGEEIAVLWRRATRRTCISTRRPPPRTASSLPAWSRAWATLCPTSRSCA